MKLKEFNAENLVVQRTTTPSIGINCKTGLFNFNKAAVEQMGLKSNDQIVVHQDEEDQSCWYLERLNSKDTRKGFTIREKSNVTAGLLFNNVALAKLISESVAFTGKSGRLLVAGQPTEFNKKKLWGIITSSLRNA